MRKQRKHYAAEEKAAILRRHLVDNEPVSKLCGRLALQPTVFCRWQKEFFENGAAAFQRLGVAPSKFRRWRKRCGCLNEHNGWVPRDHWLEPGEKQAVAGFYLKNPLAGYRRLTYLMLDAAIVALSPSSVWRVLHRAGLPRQWNGKEPKKGRGFEQPPKPHQHWPIGVSRINVSGTFYYRCSVLDGYSRAVVQGDLRETMKETGVEIVLEAAKENYPGAKPRIISDNGPWFLARDFKEFLRISGMTHVRTPPC